MYLIARKSPHHLYMNCDRIKGYRIVPKNKVPYAGIAVNEMVIVKPDFIDKIIKKKIKLRLDYYLRFIIDGIEGNDDDDSRKALDDLQRYRYFVKERYTPFLDDVYLELLDKKFDILERELKSIYIYSNVETNILEKEEVSELETKRSR